MEEKKFNCKMEDVAVITGFALASMENDNADFVAYSTVFSNQFVTDVKLKQNVCIELIKSGDVLKLQKAITAQLGNKLDELRVSLNPLEGYLKLAEKKLDIKIGDFGQKEIRAAINKGNVESVLSDTQSLIINIKRNEVVLTEKGMKPEMLIALTALKEEISLLNQQQNELKNKRSRVASDNIKIFNELWEMLSIILDAGHALYRGKDKVKLKEYTLASLLKRVSSENGKDNNSNNNNSPENPV